MKTKLIIVGIIVVIAISITYVSLAYNQEIKIATGMMTSDEKPQPAMLSDPICFVVDRGRSGETGSAVTMDRCFTLNEFEEMGCTKPMLEHLYKYSNLLNFDSDGTWYREWVGLPNGISAEDFEQCIDVILEIRPIFNSNTTKTTASLEPDSLEEIEGYAIDYNGDVKHLPFADICTDEMKIILLKYSNIASPTEQFVMEDVKLPVEMNQEYFKRCADETSFTKSRWNMVTMENP